MIYEILIEKGHVERGELAEMVNMTDRQMRRQIQRERQEGRPIINFQDGYGYFVSDTTTAIMHQYKLNQSRMIALSKQQKHLRKALKLAGQDV